MPNYARIAFKELQGGLRHLRLFMICLTLGVAVMACIGLLIESVKAGIENDAGALLGGDIEVRQLYRPLTPDAEAYLASKGKLSRTEDVRSMASAGNARMLVELKAIDEAYPLYGEFTTKPDLPYAELFGKVNEEYGVAIEPGLQEALHVKVGDSITIGDRTYRIRAIIINEPDRSLNVFAFGMRAMISSEGFMHSGLLQFGSMINYRYRLRLPEHTDIAGWESQFKGRFQQAAGWGIRNQRDAAPMFSSLFDRLSLFFSFTGLTTLLTAGLGISNAVNSYILARRKSIATLKCLGARQHVIYYIYFIQLFAVSCICIALGLLIGIAGQAFLKGTLKDFLQLPIDNGLHPAALILAAGFGFCTVVLFSLFPLYRTSYIRPTALFREASGGGELQVFPLRVYARVALLYIPVTGILMALAIAFTHNMPMVFYFSSGLIVATSVFALIGYGIKRWGNATAHRGSKRLIWTMALSNLGRPGSTVISISIALGIGISLLTALILVGGNLRDQFQSELPVKAPSFFLVDIQPEQVEPLKAALQAIPGVGEVVATPMIRGRITQLNGIAANENLVDPDARWAIRGDRGITWLATPPSNAKLVEGKWWPSDYQGPPLVSFDAKLAHGMHLKIGDTLTVSSLGQDITAKIANLRTINWGTLEMNFATILSPGAVHDLPVTYLSSVMVQPDADGAVQSLLADQFPSVSVVRVKEALVKMNDLLSNVSNAVLATAGITIFCGILVMASALSASLSRRVFDTVLLKVLGVRQRVILRILLVELVIMAASVSGVALAVGIAAAYGIMQLMIFSEFHILPVVIVTTLILSVLISIALGLLVMRRVLLIRPLALLRNE